MVNKKIVQLWYDILHTALVRPVSRLRQGSANLFCTACELIMILNFLNNWKDYGDDFITWNSNPSSHEQSCIGTWACWLIYALPVSASSHTINHNDPVLTWQCLQCHRCDHNTFLFLFFITTVCPSYINKNRKVDFECHAFRSSVDYFVLKLSEKTFY